MLKPSLVKAPFIRHDLARAGFLYNAGNFIGFAGGMIVLISTVASADPAQSSPINLVLTYLAGNTAALLMTVSTAIFFASGRAYERGFALKQGSYRGDMLSGVGAMVLGAALMALSNPILAATSGFLHAIGKFGSALAVQGKLPKGFSACSNMFRMSVLVSRAPALAISVMQLSEPASSGSRLTNLAMPAIMTLCYVLWISADLMLVQPTSRRAPMLRLCDQDKTKGCSDENAVGGV